MTPPSRGHLGRYQRLIIRLLTDRVPVSESQLIDLIKFEHRQFRKSCPLPEFVPTLRKKYINRVIQSLLNRNIICRQKYRSAERDSRTKYHYTIRDYE